MKFVVDANILFGALIKSGDTARILFDPRFDFYVPEFIFEEFKKYKEILLNKTQRKEEEFDLTINSFKEIINTISIIEILPYLEKGKEISPDEKDSVYFSLALLLNCPIWSNDKALKQQDLIKIYSTTELLNL